MESRNVIDIAGANERCGMTAPSLPPSRLHEELYVLKALLGDQCSLGAVVDLLKPEHFADPANGIVYRWIITFVRKGLTPPELLDAGGALETLVAQDLEQAGARDHLELFRRERLPHEAVLEAPARRAAGVIVNAWLARQLIDVAEAFRKAGEAAIADAYHWNPGGDAQCIVGMLGVNVAQAARQLERLRGVSVDA